MNDQPPEPMSETSSTGGRQFKDPLRELVAALPGIDNKLKAILLPPQIGLMFGIGPLIYRVSYINAGKLQFSAELYGIKTRDGQGILRPGGAIESGPPKQQKPHEVGRNPANVTLDVHSGSLDGNAIFKPRAKADGHKTPVE